MLDFLAVLPVSFIVIGALRRFIENKQNKLSLPRGLVPLPLLEKVSAIDAEEP
jgi:hypothetical protein